MTGGEPAGVEGMVRAEDRLWTPWRMRYVGGQREEGCVFCNRLAEDDDVAALILWRGERSFAIMTLFPYNTGHIMLVPNAHVPGPEEADPGALAEMATVLPGVLRGLRRALNCDGFNIGTNVGSIAGAGIAAHLHQHVVPRWNGDANFMPILASTMVMPELIPVTYAKLRAELARELGDAAETPVAIVSPDQGLVHADPDGRLPCVDLSSDQPAWRSAMGIAREIAPDAELDLLWAGSRSAHGEAALGVVGVAPGMGDSRWVEPESLADSADRRAATEAVRRARMASSP